MPEDVRTDDEISADAEPPPEVTHDDIVKRLLDYQRQLREGLEGTAAAASSAREPATTATATDELIDLTGTEGAVDDVVDVVDVSEPGAAAETPVDETVADAPPEPPAPGASVDDPVREHRSATWLADEATPAPTSDEGTADAEVILLHPETAAVLQGDTSAATASPASSPASDTGGDAFDRGSGAWPGPATEATPPSSPASLDAHASDDQAAERILLLERRLEILATRFAELRSSFQDMALAADERLAEIEDLLADVRRDA